MGTEILRPQDCLNRRIGLSRPAVYANSRRSETSYSSKTRPENRRPDPRHGRRRSQSQPSISGDQKPTVTILRRGESVESLKRLGQEPRTVSTDTRNIVDTRYEVLYAGSAFAVSPSPSSLPLPSFSRKNEVVVGVDDSATRNLRRLLRLD